MAEKKLFQGLPDGMLMRPGCIGQCVFHSVVLVRHNGQDTWFKDITSKADATAVVSFINTCVIPEILKGKNFTPAPE